MTEKPRDIPMPHRVQLKRVKGWRMPPNTVSVARPGKFGNPFTVADAIESEFTTKDNARQFVVDCFREWLNSRFSDWWTGRESEKRKAEILEGLPNLRGKNLACFCPIDQPCHADVLLEFANIDTLGDG